MPVKEKKTYQLPAPGAVMPAEPLYKRAPREDEQGRPLSDFMMLIPHLRTRAPHLIAEITGRIEGVLARHATDVVFADLNLKLNVLWVVVRPNPGICWNLPVEINDAVPDALLVAQPAF